MKYDSLFLRLVANTAEPESSTENSSRKANR